MVKKRVASSRGKTHHKPEKKADKKALPPGIKVLIAYAYVVCAFYLVYLFFGIQKPISILFGKLVTGSSALFIDLASVALLVAIIIGLTRRDYWVFWLSIVWFSFGVINAITSLIFIQTEFLILKNVLLFSAISILILNGLIIWYIYSEKKYFKTKHLDKVTKEKDKFFVYIIASVLIISVLVTATLGINFYKTTIKTANTIIQEFSQNGASPFACEEREGDERDICYVILAVIVEEEQIEVCENIDSDFYKLTCYRALT